MFLGFFLKINTLSFIWEWVSLWEVIWNNSIKSWIDSYHLKLESKEKCVSEFLSQDEIRSYLKKNIILEKHLC